MNAAPAQPAIPITAPEWWERPDRHYDADQHLVFAGHRAADLAARLRTPAYVYSAARIADNVERLKTALATIKPNCRLLYAMKCNRFPPVLRYLHELGLGLDVCSPGEIRHALACGFREDELSFTAGSLSRADYAALAGWPGVWVNVDSLTAIRRLAEVSPGRSIGLRINPGAGLGYRTNPLLQYSGGTPTKFGIYLDRFQAALELASRHGLRVEGLHCHAGCGFLSPQLPALERVFAALRGFLALAPPLKRLNLGGGLGIPLVADDASLDLAAWASLVRRFFGDTGLELEFEPGDFLVKDAGLLLTEVTQAEEKGGRTFVGLNAGFNTHVEPAFYRLPLAPAAARRRDGPLRRVTLAGNINEALDVWAEDVALPPLAEGDTLCLLNAGGYGASMASRHCLRDEFTEHLLPDTARPTLPSEADAWASLSLANRRAWDDLYASTPELVWGASPTPFLAGFIDQFRRTLQAPSRVLDAGAGEGRNLPVLLSCGADELHAIDTSTNALAKIPAPVRARVSCRHAPLHATGYPDAFFDVVVIIDVLETLPDLESVLRELSRILKPGGLLLCNLPGMDDGIIGADMQPLAANTFLYRNTYYFQFFSRDEAERLLRSAQLDVRQVARCEWSEPPHPGFRGHDHVHVSQVYLATRFPTPPGAPAPRCA